jgi:hypothetical protein
MVITSKSETILPKDWLILCEKLKRGISKNNNAVTEFLPFILKEDLQLN